MKAVFLSYNQAFHDEILDLMNKTNISGYTRWEEVKGKGSRGGEPHLGDHAWPTLNSAMIVIVKKSTSTEFMERLKELDEQNPQMGLRAFRWDVEDSI